MGDCDMDDVLCQMQVLAHLKGIQSTLGDERFKSTMPEMATIADSLPGRIASQEKTLRENMQNCGLLAREETIPDFAPLEDIPE